MTYLQMITYYINKRCDFHSYVYVFQRIQYVTIQSLPICIWKSSHHDPGLALHRVVSFWWVGLPQVSNTTSKAKNRYRKYDSKDIYIYLSLSMAEPCQTNRNETRYLQCPGDDWNLAIIVLPHVTIAMIHLTFRKKNPDGDRHVSSSYVHACKNPSTCELYLW